MGLATPQTVGKLQTTLHAKAKNSPDYRFYTLYDKMYRSDVLTYAYRLCLANGGAPGVDGQTFEDIKAYGVRQWLDELATELRKKTYRPEAVRRVMIPKPGQKGRYRPLGIPTIKDRVVETAALLVLEPIFEADLQPEQYAYRPKRSALDAVEHVYSLLDRGYREVIDADLSGYFDTIPHPELMKSVSRRISDGQMLRLLKMWLEAPVEEHDERGHRRRTTRNKDTGRGSPQGAPISPLLANLYMRRFILGWKVLGHETRLRAYIVNFADDFVICCRRNASEAMAVMRTMMGKLKLTVNEEKTTICRIPEERFDFLSYTFGRYYSYRTGHPYITMSPSKGKSRRLCGEISRLTGREWLWLDEKAQVARLNRLLVGWSNYFSLGRLRRAYRNVDHHAVKRLRQWLCRKHKVRGERGLSRFSDNYLHDQLGLVNLRMLRRNRSWAKA
jgi:group II intron reverse transcriptase/maturase